MWLMTQDGFLLNMDEIIAIKYYDKDVVARTAIAAYKVGTYKSEASALAVVNQIANWINKPTASCVYFAPDKGDMP